MSSSTQENSAEIASSTPQSQLQSQVIEVLAQTANGCLSELGYFPGMPQRLLQVEQTANKWQSENVKLFEDNRKLAGLLKSFEDRTRTSESKVSALEGRVRHLERDKVALVQRNQVLMSQTPPTYAQVLQAYNEVEEKCRLFQEDNTKLRAILNSIVVNQAGPSRSTTSNLQSNGASGVRRNQPQMNNAAAAPGPSNHPLRRSSEGASNTQPVVPSQSHHQRRASAANAPPDQNPQFYAQPHQRQRQNSSQSTSSLASSSNNSNPRTNQPQAHSLHPLPARVQVPQQISSPHQPRSPAITGWIPQPDSSFAFVALPPSTTPQAPPHQPNGPPSLSINTTLTPATAHSRPECPLTPPVSAVQAPGDSLYSQQSQTILNLPLHSSPTSPPPSSTFSSNQATPTAATSGGATSPIPAHQPIPPSLQRTPSTLDGALQEVPAFTRNSWEMRKSLTPNESVEAHTPPEPQPRRPSEVDLVLSPDSGSEGLKRPGDQEGTSELSGMARKKLRLDDTAGESTSMDVDEQVIAIVDVTSSMDSTADSYDSDDESGVIEIGPDGLRLEDDCLDVLFSDIDDDEDRKECRLCRRRAEENLLSEPVAPFIRTPRGELIKHGREEHTQAWDLLRNPNPVRTNVN